MNICCLTRITLAHEAKGGMEVHVKTMSEGLVRSGHTVTIITTGHPKEVDHEIQEGVELYYCRGTIPSQYSQTWGDASLKLLSELHRKDAFDIVWGEGGGAYYYIRAARHQLKIPAVTFLQGSFIGDLRSQIAEVRSNRNLILLFAKQLPKRIYDYFTRDMIYAGRADAVIGSSRETARDARMEYFIGKNRIYASINGIDVQRFRPLQCKSEEIPDPFGIETGAPLIFTASRLTREKGIHILIQTLPSILKSIPNAMLLVAGVGPAEDQLKTLTRNLKINSSVCFLGYVPNDALVN
ncbi:glycosyltransferase family 4 protein, partial [bacterium]|nr:glycosyltransferase family 4 protein [bacterium]